MYTVRCRRRQRSKCSPPLYRFGAHAQQKLPVIIVGGGLAGLAASIEASRAGAQVFLLEKGAKIGGNSAKATSGALCSVWLIYFDNAIG